MLFLSIVFTKTYSVISSFSKKAPLFFLYLERLRQSIEEFLKYKLKNKERLEQNIKILKKKLKNKKAQSEIITSISTTFYCLSKCFNEHSKHGNNIDELENEFLIYQTGLLLRYVNKVKLNKKTTTTNN